MKNKTGYRPSHPWYYMKGGEILSPEDIQPSKNSNLIRSFSDQITPVKDQQKYLTKLRQIRYKTLGQLEKDIQRYVEIIHKGENAFTGNPVWPDSKLNFCSALSLKHNHILYGKSKLQYIDQQINQIKQTEGFQMEIFGWRQQP